MAYRLYLILASPVVLFLLLVPFVLHKYRQEPAARALVRYSLLCLWLLVTNSAELLAKDPGWTVFFARLSYIGFYLLPLAFAGFCLRYTGHDKFVPKTVRVVLLVLAAVLYTAVLTSAGHELFWRNIKFVEVRGLLAMRPRYGPLFWLGAVYAWSIISAAVVFVIRAYSLRLGVHRARSAWILAGVFLPAVFNTVYVLRLVPWLAKDYTPIGFGLSAVAFFIGAYMIRSLRLVPTARGVVLEELDDGLLIIDSMGRLSDFNLYAGRVLGLANAELGRRYQDVPGLAGLHSCIVDSFRQAEKLGQAYCESLRCSLEQDRRTYQVKARAIFGSRLFRGIVLTISDITDRLLLEQELEATRLDMLKRERFALIGRLAANIAHEINNPLGYVWSELRSMHTLAEELAGPNIEAQRELGDMHHAVEDGLTRIRTVVANLLDYSRRGAGSVGMIDDFDLNRAVRLALDLTRSDWLSLVELRLELGDLPLLRVRGNEIDQVLLNIIRNAADAVRGNEKPTVPTRSDPGSGQSGPGAWLRIRTGVEKCLVFCELSNSGPALTEPESGRIFEPFYSTKQADQGTGLGLSISRELVEQHHGGRLYLLSGDPVCFRIELPLAGSQP